MQALAYQDATVQIPAGQPITWHTLPYSRPSRLRGVLSDLPDVAFRFRSRAYLAKAVELARTSGAVIVDFIAMAWIVAPLKRAMNAAGLDVPLVMITHNHERSLRRAAARSFAFPKNLVIGYDAWKAGRLELAANAAADLVTAIIDEDAHAFANECDTPGLVLRPGYRGPVAPTRRIDADTPRMATIIGNRESAHKLLVLEHALKALSRHGTDARVSIEIAGAGDLAALAARHPDCTFRGFVEDMPGYLHGARLGLVPDDLGGGFKMRVLTLAMLRVPILGLRSAMTGTTFVDGVHYHGVDTLDEMAAVVPTLIDDTARLDTLQNTAFAYCRDNFDWDKRGEQLMAALSSTARREARRMRA
ncbi:glycosyltransferase [Novosphingobium sp. PC22D]|uniref:glycosyltransferase n=1 Tax=Novosphingobium sp. PC22D TaxID=1962403 RepID=UPI001145D455|nr:glycosyltransferase [Novosphingobium sp. PC22D]